MSKKHNIKKITKPRDLTILKAFNNEIDLKTKIFADKTKYKRKPKHKKEELKNE